MLMLGVGWFLPVLGVSLLVSLVIDAVVGLRGARRGRSTTSGSEPTLESVVES